MPSPSVEQLNLEAALALLQERSPVWTMILASLLRAQRDRRDESEATNSMQEMNKGRAVFIIVIFLGAFACQATAGFRLLLGCYLHQSGLSRRGNEVLAGFGATPTYKYIARGISDMAARGKVYCAVTFSCF